DAVGEWQLVVHRAGVQGEVPRVGVALGGARDQAAVTVDAGDRAGVADMAQVETDVVTVAAAQVEDVDGPPAGEERVDPVSDFDFSEQFVRSDAFSQPLLRFLVAQVHFAIPPRSSSRSLSPVALPPVFDYSTAASYPCQGMTSRVAANT